MRILDEPESRVCLSRQRSSPARLNFAPFEAWAAEHFSEQGKD